MEPSPIARDPLAATNGDPDKLLEEATEVLRVESDPGWRVMIEHTGSDRVIEIACNSQDAAVALLDRIERALQSGEERVRIDPAHLVSLKALRQAWVSNESG